ncbi:MAG: hypothetical protein AB1742_00765 [bacterium]
MACTVLTAAACADVPLLMSYQGRVTDLNGVPIADGSYNMTFGLFATDTLGTAVWTETQLGVAVENGLFSVNLGASAPLVITDFNQSLWLEVTIGVTTYSPRHRVVSAGYALGIPDNAVTAAKIKDGEIANADISAAAAIADTKLAQITTAGKVSESALTGTNWTDLTDGGLTALHQHNASTLTGVVHLAPAAADADASTNPSIYINKTGLSGNLAQIQVGGVNKFVVGYDGTIDTASVDAASVVDNSLGASDIGDGLGVSEIDETVIQQRVSGSCADKSSIQVINQNGTVTCENDADLLDGYNSPQLGNFGNWQTHGTYIDCNTDPSYWGWNYVQGTTNCPNATSAQWYRGNFSLGSNYPMRGVGGYSLELAFPRYNHSTAGVWMRTVENGGIGGWTRIDGSDANAGSWTLSGTSLYPDSTAYNVAIGGTSPSVKLHVSGNAFFDLPGGGALERNLTIKNAGQGQIGFGAYLGAWTPALQIQNNDNTRHLWMSPMDSASGGGARIRAAATSLDIYTGGLTTDTGNLGFSQSTSGNVGIGTTAPDASAKLHVMATNVGGTDVGTDAERPTIQVEGVYPNVIVKSQGNASHSSTVGLWSFDGINTQQWNTGVGQNGVWSVGYCTNNANPHCGLNDYLTASALKLDTGRNLTVNPDGDFYATFKDSSGIQVYNAEGTANEVRVGAAWGKPGVYSNGSLYLGSEAAVVINDNNQENWYFDGDNFYSNGWGHIYTSSNNLHLDSYTGEMYLNYYYNNWVSVGNRDTGYMYVGNTRIFDNNDWLYIDTTPNSRIYTPGLIRADGYFYVSGTPIIYRAWYSSGGYTACAAGWAAIGCYSDGNGRIGSDGFNCEDGDAYMICARIVW